MSVQPEMATVGAAAPLVELLQQVVRAKYRLGALCAWWCVRGPGLEANIALTNIAQEEIGHAQVLESLLHEDFGQPAPERDATVTWDTWPTVGAAEAVLPSEWPVALVEFLTLDGQTTAVLHALAQHPSTRLAERARKMLQEEQFHEIFALETLQALAAHSVSVRARLRRECAAAAERLAREFPFAPVLAAAATAGLLSAEALAAGQTYARALAGRVDVILAERADDRRG